MLLLPLVLVTGQDETTIYFKGRVINGDTREPIPNAVVAVYSKTALYSTNSEGAIRLTLDKNDSVRIVVLGFSSETYQINALRPDTTGFVNMPVYPVSYTIREVTVKGYKGFLDPTIFPHREDEYKLDINLPSDIGSNMSKLPPSERLLMENPSVIEAIFTPASFIYSRFSKEQKSIRQLAHDKAVERTLNRLDDFINAETIALISGYEGEELQKFIMYCNANINIRHNDTGASVTLRIKELLKKYKAITEGEEK
ncbi:MAG: carboxypeptidase-like regulatory domain-containing protein [Cytophagaceae bacterium]|nr:carboxypeptidase-like regulatory domain-containing protein [Cytophagaceae bacterium]